MSVFGFNQVGELIVGQTYGTATDIVDFINNGTEGDVQIFSGDDTAVALNKPFKVLQKSASAKAGFEYTEIIDPRSINFVKASEYVAPVARSFTASLSGASPRSNVTYEIFIRLYNDGGTISPENYRTIAGFYVTKAGTTATIDNIVTGLAASLNQSLAKEDPGLSLFTITANTTTDLVTITGGNRPFVLGKKDGRPVEFDVTATIRDNGSETVTSGNYYDDFTVALVAPGNPGSGTGEQAANLEWYIKGNKYSRYREIEYPANFNTPYQVNPASTYHTVTIGYYKERPYTGVEKQHRVAYFLFENADQDGGGAGTAFTAVNAFIADLEIATGLTIADLS